VSDGQNGIASAIGQLADTVNTWRQEDKARERGFRIGRLRLYWTRGGKKE